MDVNAELLLDVWREVGRHLEIQDSIDRIGPLIARRMPFESVLVRVIDVERRPGRDAGSRPRAWTRGRACSRGQKRVKPSWSGCWPGGEKGEPARLAVETARRRLPGFLPPGLEGEVLCGPLRSSAQYLGRRCDLVGSTGAVPSVSTSCCSRRCWSRWRWPLKATIASAS